MERKERKVYSEWKKGEGEKYKVKVTHRQADYESEKNQDEEDLQENEKGCWQRVHDRD